MKSWKTPMIEELDVNQTAFEFSGNSTDDGFYNGITGELGMWDDPGKQSTDDMIDELS